MGSLQSDIPEEPTAPTDAQKRANIHEDEINLIDYFRVLWKRKYLVLIGSVLPALLVGLILFFSPRNYKVTYVYDLKDHGVYDVGGRSVYDVGGRSVYDVSNWNLDEKNYNVFLGGFYSEENLSKIVNSLRVNGLDRYAGLISGSGGREGLNKLVNFEVWPPYVNISKVKITDPAKLERIGQLKARLLNMTIVARAKEELPKIVSVIRNNIEDVIPVYSVKRGAIDAIRGYRAKMADIEENKFDLELTLKTNKSTLAKLKDVKPGISGQNEPYVTLQFDVGGRNEYLPLGYQIQAVETRIIELEENIRAAEEKYGYYEGVLALNKKLLSELNNKTSSPYTIQQVHLFLTDSVDGYEDEKIKDHLNSYIKRIENRMSASSPVTEKPKVCAVSRGTAKKSAIVFAISLMISLFVAFLLEGLQKSRTQMS